MLPSTYEDDVPWPEDAVEVARVIDAWGVKGWIKVHAYAADAQAVFSSRRWFVRAAEDRPRAPGAPALPRLLRITQVKEHGELIVAAAQEIPDRNAAEALKGARLFVSRSSFPSTSDGEYYWVDLIGLQVLNRESETIGTVADLLDNGAQTVLRVTRESVDAAGAVRVIETLIPFVAAFIDDVSLEQRCIRVDWGLDY